MFWIPGSILTAGLWATALSAQTAPPQATVIPQPPAARQKTERAWRNFVKKFSQEKTTVCSIPLLAVPLGKNVSRMPTLRPPVEPENLYRMPQVKLPAPPCQEERR